MPQPQLDSFDATLAQARAENPGERGSLNELFFEHKGRIVDKWTGFADVYERHLARFQHTNFALLEIGVFRGGSLEIWRKYFGPSSTIYGIDIDPSCADVVDLPNQVRIGSQADIKFLQRVVAEMGRLDVVLDDGSHIAEHQKTSFEALFPLLPVGGLYLIEDLHTSYWRNQWNGGYRRPTTAIELVKDLIDDMHGWYHGRGYRSIAGTHVASVTMYDSIVVIEKGSGTRPSRIRFGADTNSQNAIKPY